MPGKQEKCYWDTCIFTAWLKHEIRKQSEMDGLKVCVDRFDAGQIDVYTSVVTLTEVLECKMSTDAGDQFRKLLSRRNLFMEDVTQRIARPAHEIRNHFQQLNDGLKTLTTPDAIHLATAIERQCNIFFTFDQNDNPKKLSRALVPLTLWFEQHFDLQIALPPPPDQIPLPGLFPISENPQLQLPPGAVGEDSDDDDPEPD